MVLSLIFLFQGAAPASKSLVDAAQVCPIPNPSGHLSQLLLEYGSVDPFSHEKVNLFVYLDMIIPS